MPSLHVSKKNYSSKITIMSFWAPTQKCPAENSISKKSLNTPLDWLGNPQSIDT